MKEQKTDLRVTKTRKAIKGAFQELVCEVGLDGITVAMLAERAQINRKTFYLHYQTIDDLFDESIEAIMDRYFDEYETTPDMPEDISGHAMRFFLFLSEQPEFVEKLICSSSRINYGQKVYRLQMSRYKISGNPFIWDFDDDRMSLVLSFIRSTAREFYRQWVREGKKVPAQEAARLLAELTCNGIGNLMK